MNYNDEQQKEIATIRERTFKLKLSDADVERLAMKAAEGGLTMEELLENFIGDLVCGTHSNGSDERMYAQQWYDRCHFGSYAPTLSLLQHLARNGTIEEAEKAQEQLRYYLNEIMDEDLTQEERDETADDIRRCREEIAELFGPFMDPAEWQKVQQWRYKLRCMIAEDEF